MLQSTNRLGAGMGVREKVTQLIQPVEQSHHAVAEAAQPPYRPPFRQVLAAVGLNEHALASETVTVPTAALMRLLGAAMAGAEVDEIWYLDRYPDVHAAILAGATPSATVHFRAAGYREGRLPGPLPFDAGFYFDTYKDLAGAFSRTDTEALRHHYETRGYLEGRAGVRYQLGAAERWAAGLARD